MKRFAETLLRCRFVFDNYVLKREFTATNGEDGDWSLRQRLLRRSSQGRATPGYVNTFSVGAVGVKKTATSIR